MRCRECNVDLGEEYTVCPLCGSAASKDEPVLKGIQTAQYPKYDEKVLLTCKNKFHCDFPQKYIFRVALILSVIFALTAIFGVQKFWSIGVPVVFSVTAVAYFITGCLEKSQLLHSAISLIALAVASVIFVIAAAISGYGLIAMCVAFVVNIVTFFLLWLVKPKNMKAQLAAFFSL